MTREELQQAVIAIEPSVIFDEGGQFLNGNIERSNIVPALTKLKNELGFNYLFCLTCVDYKTHFTMFYHLRNLETFDELVIKAKIDDVDHPAIDSVAGLWQTANFHEREVYDLFGVKFFGHPDLRRIFLDENWPGYPLRKNYVDPNMIEL